MQIDDDEGDDDDDDVSMQNDWSIASICKIIM